MSKKYNRTFHLPFSLGATSDDKISKSVDSLLNKKLIITEKLDGSNTCLEKNGCFARSHSGPPNHESFDGLKALHANVKSDIPDHIQIFGEWCFAEHSIHYYELPSYFLVFNVRDNEKNSWESWDVVQLWADVINCPTVPVLWEGSFLNENELEKKCSSFMKEPSCHGGLREGVVVRIYDEFQDSEFSLNVMKSVRKNHVTTDNHWTHKEIIRNNLK